MKLSQILAFLPLFLFLQNNAFGIAITYDGFECLNATNANDVTLNTNSLVQSKFEVIENSQEGIYRLTLTGGIPRILDMCALIASLQLVILGFQQ